MLIDVEKHGLVVRSKVTKNRYKVYKINIENNKITDYYIQNLGNMELWDAKRFYPLKTNICLCHEMSNDMNKQVQFNIKVTMNERWVDEFCSMLKWMESCGNLGHSSVVGFYADGDGDFRPKFEIHHDYKQTKGYWKKDGTKLPELEVIYDAG